MNTYARVRLLSQRERPMRVRQKIVSQSTFCWSGKRSCKSVCMCKKQTHTHTYPETSLFICITDHHHMQTHTQHTPKQRQCVCMLALLRYELAAVCYGNHLQRQQPKKNQTYTCQQAGRSTTQDQEAAKIENNSTNNNTCGTDFSYAWNRQRTINTRETSSYENLHMIVYCTVQ